MIAMLRICELKIETILYWRRVFLHRLPLLVLYYVGIEKTRSGTRSAGQRAQNGRVTALLNSPYLRGRMFFGRVSPREPMLHFLSNAARSHDGLRRARNRTFRIGISEENAIHRLPQQRLHLGIESGSGHVHRMAAAIEVYLDRIHVGGGQKFLEVL